MNLGDIITSFLSRWRGGSEPKSVRANYGTMGPEQFNPYMSYEQQQSNPDLVFGPNASPLNIRNFGKAGFSSPEEYAAAIRSGGVYTSQAQPDDFGIIKEVLGAQEKPIAPSRPTTETPVKTSKVTPMTDEEFNKFLKNYLYYAQRQKRPQDPEYINQWLSAVREIAPQKNIDPRVIIAISALESGWGSTKYGNNLIGYGKTDSGDMGFNYENDPIKQAVDKLLTDVSGAWGGIYQNQTTPEGFVSGEKKWNYYPDWPGKVSGTLGLLSR